LKETMQDSARVLSYTKCSQRFNF